MLTIELNDTQADLGENTKIAYTSQINAIGEIEDVRTSISNQFSLPKTQINQSIIENCEDVNILTSLPYTKLNAVVKIDGLPLFKKGIATLEEINENYNFIVREGNFNFFENLEESIQNLDFSELTHTWNLTNILAYNANATGLKYLVIDWGLMDSEHFDGAIYCAHLFPCVPISVIIDKIFTTKGFYKSGEIFGDTRYLNMFVPTVEQLIGAQTKAQCLTTANCFAEQTYYDLQTIVKPDLSFLFVAGYDPLIRMSIVTDYTKSDYNFMEYEIAFDGNYTFDVSFILSIYYIGLVNPLQIKAIFYKNDVAFTSYDAIDVNNAVSNTINNLVTVNCNAGDKLRFMFMFVYTGSPGYINITAHTSSFVNCTVADVERTSFGFQIEIAKNLPDFSQKDFLKWFMKTFGLIVETDVFSNTVNFICMNEIDENKSVAIDFSDKINVEKTNTQMFSDSNFGQKNWYRYAEDENITNQLGDYYFLINNENLEAKKEIYKAPFAASHSISHFNIDMIKIENLEAKETETGSGIWIAERKTNWKPRICMMNKISVPTKVYYFDGATLSEQTLNIPCTYFVDSSKSFDLNFQTILTQNYGTFIRIMQTYRKLIASFVLTMSDLINFSHFVPVYVRKFSSFFYVNKISNFQQGKSTDVELIKL